MHFSHGNLTHLHQLSLNQWVTFAKAMGRLYVSSFGRIPPDGFTDAVDINEYVNVNCLAINLAITTLKSSFDFVACMECIRQAVTMTKLLINEDDVDGIAW